MDVRINIKGNSECMSVQYSTKPDDMSEVEYYDFLTSELGYALANLCMIRAQGNKGMALTMAEQALTGTKRIISSDVLDSVEMKTIRKGGSNGRTGQGKAD